MENNILDKSLESSNFGILHIRSLYSRKMDEIKGNRLDNKLLNQLDYFVLDGLEIPIAKAVEYLYLNQPKFKEFEDWILSWHSGTICTKKLSKINDAVIDFIKNGEKEYPLETAIDDPIFSYEEMKFWDENGYIILKNAVDKNDCKELEDAIWKYLELSPSEPQSWKYTKDRFWLKDFSHFLLIKNRSSNKIQRAFNQLWGTNKLFLSIDRISFNPPINSPDNSYGPNKLHWDISLSSPVPLDLFGMLYLNDIKKEQGAFQCIPGFHKKLDKWLDNLDKNIDPRIEILKDEYQAEIFKVSANTGDFIICNHALPHSSSINSADYPRFVHYMDMYPANRKINPIWK